MMEIGLMMNLKEMENIIYKNGNYYIGEWKEGKKHGKGIKFDKDGNVILEGTFNNGDFIDSD